MHKMMHKKVNWKISSELSQSRGHSVDTDFKNRLHINTCKIMYAAIVYEK